MGITTCLYRLIIHSHPMPYLMHPNTKLLPVNYHSEHFFSPSTFVQHRKVRYYKISTHQHRKFLLQFNSDDEEYENDDQILDSKLTAAFEHGLDMVKTSVKLTSGMFSQMEKQNFGTSYRKNLLEACPYSTLQKLPRLPVPPLKQTLDKFLITVKPLLSSDDFQRASELVNKFVVPGGRGEHLQKLLENRANNTVNWLEEWWLNIAYLEYRLPVAIHVNPGIYTPPFPFKGEEQQLKYAATLIARIIEYKKNIDTLSLPVDRLGKTELCMKQFYRILGCCRVPATGRDNVAVHLGGCPDSPRHINVLRNNHIFSLDVYDTDGQPLSIGQLYTQLTKIADMSQTVAPPIGILTSEHRDVWCKVYEKLIESKTNKKSLTNIQQSIFVLALDRPVSCNERERDNVFLNQVEHGGGSHLNSGNRWFDKVFQAFVTPDGQIGFNYEHSTAEGPPIIHLIDYCYSKLRETGFDQSVSSSKTDGLKDPHRLQFKITKEIDQSIRSASASLDQTIDNLDLIHFKFDKFGKDFIKTLQVSPDAFIQIAFQLSYFRLHGTVAPTYESGSLRKFQHGRTDTIRSCSSASLAYCQAMTNKNASQQERTKLLKEAIDLHRRYTDDVISGRGIDRHLLGLKLIAAENNLELPELLQDPVYEKTCYWKISTSQVASKYGGLLCFAPVVPEGYGICYNPMENFLLFSISSWRDYTDTDARRFSASLHESLSDAASLLEPSTILTSKL